MSGIAQQVKLKNCPCHNQLCCL